MPFLYVANKTASLKIYDISDLYFPELAAEVASSELAGLDVMNLFQDGHFIYLAFGNHFTNPQQGGMILINVSDPENPVVKDTYIVPDSESVLE